MNEFPDLRAALVAAAERQRDLTPAKPGRDRTASRPRSTRRSSWPLQLRAVAIAVTALLVLTAVALAAAGVFSPGRAVKPVAAPNPHAFDGAAVQSTIRLLTLRAPDPDGGPQWGLRLVQTTRGEFCITPGRVQSSVIGVLGRDQAFGNDGRLHPFARDYIGPIGCAVADARGHAFLSIGQMGLPSSALLPGAATRAGGCQVDNPPPADHALLCPTSVLRDVYYGLLGPAAVSITYRTASGRVMTERTAGPDGAYLIVLPYAGELQGTGSIGTGFSGRPFVSVSYRGGYTCSTTHGRTCQPVGYQPPRATHLTAANVRAPISARLVQARSYCNSRQSGTVVACNGRVPRGFSRMYDAPFVLVDVSFTARVPVNNSHSYYEVDFNYAKSPGCTVGGTGGPTHTDIHAGQRIHTQDYVPLSCPGPVHGIVTYVPSSTLGPPDLPGSAGVSSVLVGRFVVNPTTPQRTSR